MNSEEGRKTFFEVIKLIDLLMRSLINVNDSTPNLNRITEREEACVAFWFAAPVKRRLFLGMVTAGFPPSPSPLIPTHVAEIFAERSSATPESVQ